MDNPCIAVQKSDIKYSGNSISDAPKYYYTPVLRGQVAYLLSKCKEEGIKAEYMYGKLYIYNNRKIQVFKEIILKSLSKNFTYTVEDMKKETQYFHVEKKFVCIAIKSLDLIITTEVSFDSVIYYQFLGKIPVARNYKIYSKYKDLVTGVEEEFNIVF